ncbi:MAG: hypothetical protein CMN71_11905 [Sphingomonadaceae bacterium]|nr:hypothetical protein [Sphingomonadaceae bacterium]
MRVGVCAAPVIVGLVGIGREDDRGPSARFAWPGFQVEEMMGAFTIGSGKVQIVIAGLPVGGDREPENDGPITPARFDICRYLALVDGDVLERRFEFVCAANPRNLQMVKTRGCAGVYGEFVSGRYADPIRVKPW